MIKIAEPLRATRVSSTRLPVDEYFTPMLRAWTARPAEIEFVFIGFWFFSDERLICRVTGPRRFPPPNHATGF
jgi:hypothetical protein